MLQKLWRSDELIWLPSQYTKESNEAGIMTLATRLGLDEETFSMLKKQSGCTKFGSWNKHFGVVITTYDAKYYGVNWIALGAHSPGPNGWEKSPNYFYDRAISRLRVKYNINDIEWFDHAFIQPTPVNYPNNLHDRRKIPSNKCSIQVSPVPHEGNATTRQQLQCVGLRNARVDQYAVVNSSYCLGKWDYSRGSWRSKICSSVAVDGKRCSNCLSSRNNINKRHHPILFDDPVMTSIFPDAQTCDDHLMNMYNSMPVEEFMSNPTVTRVAKLLKLVLPENASKTTVLSKDSNFVVCHGNDDSCLHYALVKEQCRISLCLNCKNKRSNETRREKRKELDLSSPDPDKRTKASSKCNLRYLSPEELTKRAKNLNDDRKKNTVRMKKLISKLTEKNESFNKEDDPELLSCVKSALAEVDGKQHEFKKALVAAILEHELATNGKKCSNMEITEKDYAEFIDQVMTEMKNFSLRLSNKVSSYYFTHI